MNPEADRGTLADVRDARRAFWLTVEPRWLRVLVYGGLSAWIAGILMINRLVQIFHGTAIPIIVAVGVVYFAGMIPLGRRGRALPVRPRPYRPWSRRGRVAQGALLVSTLVAYVGLVALLLLQILPDWAFALAAFVVMFAMLYGLAPVAARIDPYGTDIPALLTVPDQPPVLDPQIEPRLPLMACAVLAPLEWVGTDLLATTLRISDQELSTRAAGLVRAEYLQVYADARRWWCGLTPAGRAAYRRHLRALLEASVPASA